MNDKFTIGWITMIAVTCILALYFVTAYAEPGEKSKTPYPYVDPVLEYYDSRLHYSHSASEPVYYLSFFIAPLGTVQCDVWNPVYGIIPELGLLTFTVTSGDYIGYANVSHMEAFYLLNYFYLPCENIDQDGELYVTYTYNDNSDKEIYPNTKVTDMGFDRSYLQITVPFKVQ